MMAIPSELFIKNCQKLKPHEIIKILDDYRTLKDFTPHRHNKSILISIKIPESLLEEFKTACSEHNVKYQTQMKNLMRAWLSK